jgi:hypothetical protein
MELIQDDDIFHSVVVGYGCMGVVYAYTMKVVDEYWLREETKLLSWGALREKLDQPPGQLKDFLQKNGTRHCQIYINTATTQLDIAEADKVREHQSGDDDHGVWEDQQHEAYGFPLCMVKRLIPVEPPDGKPDNWENITKETGLKDIRWPPERRASPWQDAGQDLLKYHPLDYQPGKSKQLHNNFFHPGLNKDPFVGGKYESAWYVALRRARDEGASTVSNKEYYEPEPPNPPTLSTEVGVPTHETVELIDAFLDLVEGDRISVNVDGENEKVHFYAPIGIRFTAPSDHYLSPEHNRATTMVELPLPLPQKDKSVGGLKPAVPKLGFDDMRDKVVEPSLETVEWLLHNEYSDLDPRPHMGKVQHPDVDKEWVDENYEYFDASDDDRVDTGWRQAYQRFNAFGTFDNKFTDQLGLSDGERFSEPLMATVTSDDEETSTEDSDNLTVSVETPGFGVFAGLAGLGTGAWLHRRRSDDDETADSDETGAIDGEDDGNTTDERRAGETTEERSDDN